MQTFLEEIFELKKKRVEQAKLEFEISNLKFQIPQSRPPHLLRAALTDDSKLNVIAEFKRASPSKGIINDQLNPIKVAQMYERGGAVAMSILTEEDKFCGSLNDLKDVRGAVNLPLLRKDFIFDEFQIREAKAAGADVILLIVAMLNDAKLLELLNLAEEELGLDALVEVHTKEELIRALDIGAKIIGVNNRDLHSFKVSLDVSRELIKFAPNDVLMIAESGLTIREDLLELKKLGFNGFLIGESLMRSENPEEALRDLIG